MWEVEFTETFEQWWLELTEQEQDDVTAMVELLQEKGIHLPFPYSSGIKESKFSHNERITNPVPWRPNKSVLCF